MKTTYFGLTPFKNAELMQAQAFRLVEQSGYPVVMGFEFYPVVTLGKRANIQKEIPAGIDDLEALGINLVQTDRGGLATLHSPGQLVIYPLVPIRKLKISVRDYVNLLEESTILWLKKYGIQTGRNEDAGVFTDKGKIAFVGIRVEKGITRHGISINISNDLNLFRHIRSCGTMERNLDSFEAHSLSLDLRQAFEEWIHYFTALLLERIPPQ